VCSIACETLAQYSKDSVRVCLPGDAGGKTLHLSGVSGVNLTEIESPVIHLDSIENEDRNDREASHLVTEQKKFEEALLASSGRCLGVVGDFICQLAAGCGEAYTLVRKASGLVCI